MRVSIAWFWTPKKGNTVQQYEDAFAWAGHNRYYRKKALEPIMHGVARHLRPCLTTHRFRAAIADGATEGIFSRLWAQILVTSFCYSQQRLDGKCLESLLPAAREQWELRVKQEIREREKRGESLPWYLEAKIPSGGYATFLGLELREIATGRGIWSAIAIGDACCIHMRRGRVLTSFPLNAPDAFGNRPPLVSSRAVSSPDCLHYEAEWRFGDSFYLMTDALAAWFLQELHTGKTPWHDLNHYLLRKRPDHHWLSTQVERKHLKSDDLTLLRITVG